jgi:integrase
MFAQPNSDYCPVNSFNLYVAKRPEELRSDPDSRFYLRPLPTPTENDVWYSRQPLGKNKLGIIMKTMALTAELYGRKVNHSTRKTFFTTLLQSDRPITEVAHLGGWKSVSTLTHYNAPSIKQQSKAYTILSEIEVQEIVI